MADEDDDEWRFSVDEVGPDDPDDGADAVAADDGASDEDDEWVTMVGEDDDGPTVGVATGDPEEGEESGGNVAGSLVPDSVEPGTPALENVVFATLGAILTVLIFAGIVVDLDPVTVGALSGGVATTAALLYLLFRRF